MTPLNRLSPRPARQAKFAGGIICSLTPVYPPPRWLLTPPHPTPRPKLTHTVTASTEDRNRTEEWATFNLKDRLADAEIVGILKPERNHGTQDSGQRNFSTPSGATPPSPHYPRKFTAHDPKCFLLGGYISKSIPEESDSGL